MWEEMGARRGEARTAHGFGACESWGGCDFYQLPQEPVPQGRGRRNCGEGSRWLRGSGREGGGAAAAMGMERMHLTANPSTESFFLRGTEARRGRRWGGGEARATRGLGEEMERARVRETARERMGNGESCWRRRSERGSYTARKGEVVVRRGE